uniref:Phosphate uptake regulator PhoU n=1 Tax=Geoglobus ahangari TaxID=113653 RepID=A0A7C3UIA3_9EURY
METRKIFRSGRGSYILTLPKEWIRKNGLREGDVLHLEVSDDCIMILPKYNRNKKAFVDLEGLSFEGVVRRIVAYYLANYDTVRLKVQSDEQRRAIAFVSEMLIGMEIMEDTGSEVELIVYLDPYKINLDETIGRISKVCISMFSDLVKISTEKFDRSIASSIIVRESEVDRLCFLILRLAGNLKFHRSFARSIERIADHIEAMTEATMILGKSYCELSIGNEILNVLKQSSMAFLKLDIEMAENVLEKVAGLKGRISNLQERLLNYSKSEIIALKTIIDGMERILAYSSDIAELVIDRSVE